MAPILDNVLQLAGHPYFALLVAVLNFADTFVLVMPNDVLLIAAVSARPRAWFGIALLVASFSIFGASLFAMALQGYPDVIKDLMPGVFQSSAWQNAEEMYRTYGLIAAFIGTAGPFPIHPFLLVGVAAGVDVKQMLSVMFLGRCTKYLVVAYIAAKLPHLLGSIGMGKPTIDDSTNSSTESQENLLGSVEMSNRTSDDNSTNSNKKSQKKKRLSSKRESSSRKGSSSSSSSRSSSKHKVASKRESKKVEA